MRLIDMPSPTERFNLSITTTSGDLHAQIDIPTGFIAITDIVPVVRSLGEQAQELEVARTIEAGKSISCQKGCAACCRIMIPVSPPEAFALVDVVKSLPDAHRARIQQKLADTQSRLQDAGLLPTLRDMAESTRQQTDEELDMINRIYYALRLPCIFLEDEMCSIYDHRPAGCRGHLVSSPPELCQDTEKNPVQELHIPVRAGTVLKLSRSRRRRNASPKGGTAVSVCLRNIFMGPIGHSGYGNKSQLFGSGYRKNLAISDSTILKTILKIIIEAIGT